jgi:hypothetical protein
MEQKTKVIEIAEIPVQYASFKLQIKHKNLKIFHVANVPYYEEGFFYSSSFKEMVHFMWSFKKENSQFFGIFNSQRPEMISKLEEVANIFVQPAGQIRVHFKRINQIEKIIKDFWDFEKEYGEIFFLIVDDSNYNFLVNTSKKFDFLDVIQISSTIFVRGHDCAFMEIYAYNLKINEIIDKLKESTKDFFEIKYIENYLETDWVRSWDK